MTFEELQGTTVFEIPIYALPPEEHHRRFKRKLHSEEKRLCKQGMSLEVARETVQRRYQHLSEWKYNQLIGMFHLTINNNDSNCDRSLLCHLYCNKVFPRTFTAHAYLPFRNRYLVYERIYLDGITSDQELVDAIKEKIDFLKVQEGIENSYFDCTALENMFSLLKVKSIFTDN